jgi:hypothetical protein
MLGILSTNTSTQEKKKKKKKKTALETSIPLLYDAIYTSTTFFRPTTVDLVQTKQDPSPVSFAA